MEYDRELKEITAGKTEYEKYLKGIFHGQRQSSRTEKSKKAGNVHIIKIQRKITDQQNDTHGNSGSV
jgi:hypothetical protein